MRFFNHPSIRAAFQLTSHSSTRPSRQYSRPNIRNRAQNRHTSHSSTRPSRQYSRPIIRNRTQNRLTSHSSTRPSRQYSRPNIRNRAQNRLGLPRPALLFSISLAHSLVTRTHGVHTVGFQF